MKRGGGVREKERERERNGEGEGKKTNLYIRKTLNIRNHFAHTLMGQIKVKNLNINKMAKSDKTHAVYSQNRTTASHAHHLSMQ